MKSANPRKRQACNARRDIRSDLAHGYVWTLKHNERVVHGTDVHRRALVRRADMFTGVGRGGIASLLLPRDPHTLRRLELDRRFKLTLVMERRAGERGNARDLKVIAEFLLVAIPLQPETCRSAKATCEWIVRSLQDRNSDLYRLAARRVPTLLEHPRGVRWWQNRVTELRRMSR
jgi:hypothetical protein